MQKLWNEPIGILGFGAEGKSTLKFLQEMGVGNISIFDKSNGTNYLDNLQNCKTIIRSAGVYPLQKEILNAQAKGVELTSQIELFFKIMQHNYPYVQIVGITGTLGKGSCVSMVAHCLDALNVPHKIGGNFGIPALDLLQHKNLLQNKDTVIILELSSFQLMTLGFSPHIGVVLQTTTEHLDWHTSVEQYRDAKANLVRWQKKSDYCIYNKASEWAEQIANQSNGIKKPFSVEGNAIEIEGNFLSISECKITGAHQLQNMAAALLALQSLGFNVKTCMEHLKNYRGLEYRLQKIGSKFFKNKNLDFYNDSYSTRPEAAISAVASMSKPFAIILGGSEKYADFTELSRELAKNNLLNSVALIGATSERLQKSLQSENCKVTVQIFENLPAAFQWCLENTPNNGAILLSPACASFGLFANYKERGEAFNKLLNSLNFIA